MYHSVRAGRPVVVPEEPTVASALAGGIGPENRYTFPLVRDTVDVHVLVPEDQILDAVRWTVREHNLVVEGGAAVGVAAVLQRHVRRAGVTAVVVSGGNIDVPRLVKILSS